VAAFVLDMVLISIPSMPQQNKKEESN